MLSQVKAEQGGSTRTTDGSTDTGGASTTTPAPATSSSEFVFPIKGAHDYGTSVNRFGAPRGGRSHMGQDVLADCGLPVLAVEGGKVVYRGYQSAAGNYIVIKGSGTKRDYVYMHLRSRALYGPTTASRPARASAPWATPATRPPATCTSSSGRRRAGTTAATRSTRCPTSRTGTPPPDGAAPGGARSAR